MPIRVLLADDHAIFRRGVHSLLAEYPDIEIVGEAENSPATLRQVAEHNPDVVLLDVQMEGASGVEVARTLRQNHPHVGVIILTTFDNDEYLFGAIQAGAHAYVLKDIALQTLPETIRAVWRGERLISTQLIGRVLQQFQDLANERVRRDTGLSPEDLDILRIWLTREEAQADVLVSLGQTAYLRYCAVCHGPDAQGRPGLGKNLITSSFVAGQSDADLVQFIREGRPADDPLNTTGIAMLPYGGQPTLSDADLTNLVAYMRSVNLGKEAIAALPPATPAPATPTPAAATQTTVAEPGGAITGAIDGAAVFARLNPPCLTCHQLGGKGSKFGPGPNLDDLKDVAATRVEGLSAEEYVHQSIVEPGAFVVKQCPAGPCVNAMPKTYPDQMTTEELDALVQYLLNH